MNEDPQRRSGAEALIAALDLNGVERIFCIPGESYLAALDALHRHPRIELVVCRNEGGAAYMAEADAKLTGRPGVCFVTRGPGACNASGGLHVALQDSTPLLLLIGQVARGDVDREAFQEIDYRRMLGQVTKWSAQIDDPARIPEYVNHAWSVATGGRPGPVALALPEDMLAERTGAADARPWQAVAPYPPPVALDTCAVLLAQAERPLVIVGGGGWSDATRQGLQRVSERHGLPVINSFRCQDYFDNEHPNYAGDLGLNVNPALRRRVAESDCLLVIGSRLGELSTGGFTLIAIPTPAQPLVHVHADIHELGRIYQPQLAINAASPVFVEALDALPAPATPPATRARWIAAAREDYLRWTRPGDGDRYALAHMVRELARQLDEDAIVCNGAGINTAWLQRFYRFRRYRTQLAPTSGSMGYGLAAAVGAKLRYPGRTVVAWCGDGDFMMNGQELATAMQYRAALVVIIVNNGSYGTIRMHQERAYPARVSGTDMVNPDFVKLAEAHGAHAERVSGAGEFGAALERALAARRLALIEIVIDPGQLLPELSIDDLRARPA